jgi:hypothetical protein
MIPAKKPPPFQEVAFLFWLLPPVFSCQTGTAWTGAASGDDEGKNTLHLPESQPF